MAQNNPGEYDRIVKQVTSEMERAAAPGQEKKSSIQPEPYNPMLKGHPQGPMIGMPNFERQKRSTKFRTK